MSLTTAPGSPYQTRSAAPRPGHRRCTVPRSAVRGQPERGVLTPRRPAGRVRRYVNEGVIPVGINWARNPIPFIFGARAECANATSVNATDSTGMLCRQFPPPCADGLWGVTPGSDDPSDLMGVCSGNWVGGVIVDTVTVPDGLTPGPYVLGFRWDAEVSFRRPNVHPCAVCPRVQFATCLLRHRAAVFTAR